MTYVVLLSEAAKAELVVIKKSGDKSTLKKIANLLVELQEHPRIGTGQGWLIKGRTSNGAHILGCNPVIVKSRNIGIVSLFIAFLLLSLTSLTSCNKTLNTKEYNGQMLSRYLTVLSNRTYITRKNEKVGWNDTLAIFVDNQGKAILVNDIPVNESLPDSGNVRYLPNYREDYEYNYDAHGHLISATTTWTDTPEYKFIWKNNLVTEIIITGCYYGNTTHEHIIYDMTVDSPRSGIDLFMDIFDTKKLIAKYITGEVGGYVPSHPIAKIYVYDDKFGNDTLTFTNEFDGKNRLTAYTVKSHTTNVSRHFDYPD